MTMTLVSTVEVGSGGAASIEFTGIAGTATDLLILLSSRTTDATTNSAQFVYFNSDTDTGSQTGKIMLGNGSSITNVSWAYGIRSVASSATSSTFGNASIYIPNYSGSTNKSISIDSVGENNATAAEQAIFAGLWPFTAAITSVKIGSLSGNFVQYSTASLYTITKGSGGATVS